MQRGAAGNGQSYREHDQIRLIMEYAIPRPESQAGSGFQWISSGLLELSSLQNGQIAARSENKCGCSRPLCKLYWHWLVLVLLLQRPSSARTKYSQPAPATSVQASRVSSRASQVGDRKTATAKTTKAKLTIIVEKDTKDLYVCVYVYVYILMRH
jgi:hypothetical protein